MEIMPYSILKIIIRICPTKFPLAIKIKDVTPRIDAIRLRG